VIADAPILDGDVVRIDAAKRAFFAAPSRDHHSTVVYYRVARGKKPEPIWTMPGWYSVAWLSDDGDYLVTGYPGNNLLELDHKPNEVMLSFYRRGVAVGTIRLDAILENQARMRKSVSHYGWGHFLGFVAPHQFAVTTIEDRELVYDVTTGKQLSANPVPTGGMTE
jgi:hypothetical protein